MKIDISILTKEVHFPIVQAQPTKKVKGFSLIKSFFTFKRLYVVKKDYFLWSEYLKSFIFIPSLFEGDNASVPKALSSLFKSDGLLLLGALPHDFSYRYQGLLLLDEEGFVYFKPLSQAECDLVLENLSAWESGLKKSAKTARIALSIVGGFTYRSWKKDGRKVDNDFPGLF